MVKQIKTAMLRLVGKKPPTLNSLLGSKKVQYVGKLRDKYRWDLAQARFLDFLTLISFSFEQGRARWQERLLLGRLRREGQLEDQSGGHPGSGTVVTWS